MICPYCNTEQADGIQFCTECGKYIGVAEPTAAEVETPVAVPVSESAAGSAPESVPHTPVTNVQPCTEDTCDPKPPKDSKWATVGTWGWIGVLLLLQIPVVNLVMVILWSFGVGRKQVLQSFSRAVLVLGLVTAIITVVGIILMAKYGQAIYSNVLSAIF